jgi:hypothetical protein
MRSDLEELNANLKREGQQPLAIGFEVLLL